MSQLLLLHARTVCICVAFVAKHSYNPSWVCGDVASREGVGGTLVVMPLGTQSRDDPRLETVATLVKALRAFCHPLAWDTLHLRALQASMLRMFPTVTVADGGGRALQAAAVLDSASRNVARGAVASIVVSFTDVADERCVPACDSVFLSLPSLFSRKPSVTLPHTLSAQKSGWTLFSSSGSPPAATRGKSDPCIGVVNLARVFRHASDKQLIFLRCFKVIGVCAVYALCSTAATHVCCVASTDSVLSRTAAARCRWLLLLALPHEHGRIRQYASTLPQVSAVLPTIHIYHDRVCLLIHSQQPAHVGRPGWHASAPMPSVSAQAVPAGLCGWPI